MEKNPFTDAWLFLIGSTPDHVSLGAARYPFAALFICLLLASAAIARANWSADPAQRSSAHFWTWLLRVLMGSM